MTETTDSGLSGEMLDAAYEAAREYLPGDVARAKMAIIKAYFAIEALKKTAGEGYAE